MIHYIIGIYREEQKEERTNYCKITSIDGIAITNKNYVLRGRLPDIEELTLMVRKERKQEGETRNPPYVYTANDIEELVTKLRERRRRLSFNLSEGGVYSASWETTNIVANTTFSHKGTLMSLCSARRLEPYQHILDQIKTTMGELGNIPFV
ncbi:hypothetical protein HYV86_03200 [Candidatus Woesearchaeota archaeon]|nr:hypothetical protein [Candidatus Woesearchaeota archaeon]